jgi:hypothetical protein
MLRQRPREVFEERAVFSCKRSELVLRLGKLRIGKDLAGNVRTEIVVAFIFGYSNGPNGDVRMTRANRSKVKAGAD